jgi:2,3-bisphosphoglycerate-independent phosphoglycerate mutase
MDNDNSKRPRPLVLCFIDGFGVAQESDSNAVSLANLKTIDGLLANYPATVLSVGDSLKPSQRYLAIGSGSIDGTGSISLGKALASAGLRQLRLSDSEGFPLLASFLDGADKPLPSTDYKSLALDPSDDVNINPTLTSRKLAKELLQAIKGDKYDFIAVRFSSLDLAARAGQVQTAVSALEVLDRLLAKVLPILLGQGGALALLSAYGWAERMYDVKTELVETGLTSNPVPFFLVSDKLMGKTVGLEEAPSNDLSLLQPSHDISAVAPTILELLGVPKPKEMKGESWL